LSEEISSVRVIQFVGPGWYVLTDGSDRLDLGQIDTVSALWGRLRAALGGRFSLDDWSSWYVTKL